MNRDIGKLNFITPIRGSIVSFKKEFVAQATVHVEYLKSVYYNSKRPGNFEGAESLNRGAFLDIAHF